MGKQLNELLTGLTYAHALVLIKKFEYETIITEINGFSVAKPKEISSPGKHYIKIKLHKADADAYKKLRRNKIEIVDIKILDDAVVEIDNGEVTEDELNNQFYNDKVNNDEEESGSSESSENGD